MTTLADPSAKLLLSDQLAGHAEKAMVILCSMLSKSSLSLSMTLTLTLSEIDYSLSWCYHFKRGD